MSIEKRKSKNRISYRVRVMQNGKSIGRTFQRKHDALLFENEAMRNEHLIKVKDFTFNDAAKRWIKLHAEVRKTNSGILMDKSMLEKNIAPHIGHLKISRITSDDIEEMIAFFKAKGLSNSTINRNLCVIRTIFNYYSRKRVIHYNPIDGIDKLKDNEYIYTFWNLKDAQTFLEYTKSKYANNGRYSTYLIYLVALNTGMRLGELLALQWGNVDFTNRIISVRSSFSCHERRVNNRTKSGHQRHVPINRDIYDELHNAYKNCDDCKWVFNWHRVMIDPHNLRQRCFYKDIKESNVEKIRFHDLRHTFASHYMMNGGSLYDLQKILGHSNFRMTERYAHLSANYLADKGDVVSFTKGNVIHAEFKHTG